MTRFLNVASNLAYAIVGTLVLLIGGPFAILSSAGNYALTVGSSLFHFFEKKIEVNRKYKWAQRLDEIGMYAAIVPLMWAALAEALSLPTEIVFILIIVQVITMGALYRFISSTWALGAMFGITFLAALTTGSTSGILFAALLFAGAYWIRSVNHPVWHLATAAAYYKLYESIYSGEPSLYVFVLASCAISVAGIYIVYRSDGILHALIYGRGRGVIHSTLRFFNQNIHEVGSLSHVGLTMAAVPMLPLLYIMKGWVGVVVAATWIYAGSRLAANSRQKWINRGSGLPDVDPNENPKFEIFGIWLPKLFYGETRVAKTVVAALLIVLGFVVLHIP